MSAPQDQAATEPKPMILTQSASSMPKFVFKNGKLDRAGTMLANGLGQPRLQVVHGRKPNAEFTLKEGVNLLGRPVEGPVDVDLSELEPANLVLSSRRHALVFVENQNLFIQDCTSRNGTQVNDKTIQSEVRFPLNAGDLVQIGAVQFRVLN